MVDTRLRGDWLHNPRFDDLSNDAWRLFTLAMMWSNEQGTDGHVPTRYARILHPDIDIAVAAELAAAGLVEQTDDGIQLVGWDSDLGQSSAEYVSRKREEARLRMRNVRQSRSTSGARESMNVRANRAENVHTDVGQAPSSSSSSPGAYVPPNVRANDVCPKHPNGDIGEPCAQCAAVRQARAAKPTPTPRAAKPGDGHVCRPDEFGNCVLCQTRVVEEAA
jgi:hypothetical protein